MKRLIPKVWLLMRVFVFATLLLPLGTAQANGPEIGFNAGSIFPVASKNIQLIRESILVNFPLDWQKIEVRCEYVLCNLSNQDQTFTMGFVTAIPLEHQYVESYRNVNLQVSQGSRQLAVSFTPVDRSQWQELLSSVPDSLPVWEVSIPAQGSATLNIVYFASWSGGGEGSHASKYFTYYALPAKLWAGPIEKATITFYLGEVMTKSLRRSASQDTGVKLSIQPSGYTWYSSGLKWEFSNWEPNENPRIMIEWYEEDE